MNINFEIIPKKSLQGSDTCTQKEVLYLKYILFQSKKLKFPLSKLRATFAQSIL